MCRFRETGAKEVPSVGVKTALLGKVYAALSSEGILVPNGFGITAEVYRTVLTTAGAWGKLRPWHDDLCDVELLAKSPAAARESICQATGTAKLRAQIARACTEADRSLSELQNIVTSLPDVFSR